MLTVEEMKELCAQIWDAADIHDRNTDGNNRRLIKKEELAPKVNDFLSSFKFTDNEEHDKHFRLVQTAWEMLETTILGVERAENSCCFHHSPRNTII